jgi:hypothetical protein
MTTLDILDAHAKHPGTSKVFISKEDNDSIVSSLSGLFERKCSVTGFSATAALSFHIDETQPVGTLRFE